MRSVLLLSPRYGWGTERLSKFPVVTQPARRMETWATMHTAPLTWDLASNASNHSWHVLSRSWTQACLDAKCMEDDYFIIPRKSGTISVSSRIQPTYRCSQLSRYIKIYFIPAFYRPGSYHTWVMSSMWLHLLSLSVCFHPAVFPPTPQHWPSEESRSFIL